MIKQNGFTKKFIGNKAFYAMILGVALPIMIQNGITSFVNMLDNIMVGRIGTEQMSGVSIVNTLYSVYMLCMFGGLSGAGIFTSQYYGKQAMEGVRHTFRYKIWMAVILTALAYVIFIAAGKDLIGLYLNSSSDAGDLTATLEYGEQYLHILFISFPAFMILQVYASTLRESGQTKIPMAAGIAAVLVNMVLNYILIFGKLGLPALGVRGAAIATVIARYVEASVCVIWTHRHKDRCPYIEGIYSTLKVPGNLIKKYFLKGSPLLLNEALWSMGNSILLQCYSVRGLNAIAAFNIASTVYNVFNLLIIAMGNAVAIIVGQKLGAGDMEEAKDTDNKIIFTAICLSIVTGALMASISGLFPMIYNTNDEAKHLASGVILIYACFQPVHAFYNSTYFTLRAGGKTIITFLFDSCYMWVINIPLAFVLSRCTELPVLMIFLAVSSVDIIKCIIGFILIKKNVWLNNIVA